MTFTADYPGAIVVEAANYGYPGQTNKPRAWGLHTPEEPPDDVPSTPYYFAKTTRDASTNYFVSFLAFVFQMVPETQGAYGQAVQGKPYPAWANPSVNLNLQSLSVEIEGFAATIHLTMPRGAVQWIALVDLVAHRCLALDMPPEWTFGHYEVSTLRGDPGQLNIGHIIEDVKRKMAEMEDFYGMLKYIKRASSAAVYATDGIYKWGITSNTLKNEMTAKGIAGGGVQVVTDNLFNRITTRPRNAPLTAAQTQVEVKRAILAYDGKFRQWCREAIVSSGINIPNVHKRIETAIVAIGSGGGATVTQIVAAVKRALKEGTG